MCTVIYEFDESRLLLCPKVKNVTSNSTNGTVRNTDQPKNNSQTPSPLTPSLYTPTPSPLTPSPLTPTPSPLTPTPSPLTPTPSIVTPSSLTPSSLTPSMRSSLRSRCHCDCASSRSDEWAPSPSNLTSNHTNTAMFDGYVPNLQWLHVFWCFPVFLIIYMCYRRHCWSKIQVGIALRRQRYEVRSKSWPRRVRTPHPAVTKRSRSESFDTIVL